MAKIALITRKITPQVLALARGLLSQRHEIQVITSYRTEFNIESESALNIEILAYFKKWNWLETIRLIPRILQRPPDIFHFIFENNEDRAQTAHQILSQLALRLRRSTVVTVGNSAVDSKSWHKSSFLNSCQALIAPSREKLMYLKRQGLIDKHVKTEVILPLPIHEVALVESSSEQKTIYDQCQKWKPYILVPSQPRKKIVDQLVELVQGTGLKLIFIGSRSERVFADLRFTCLANPSSIELETLTQHAKAVMLATHEYEPAELMQWQKVCSKYQTPILALRRQVEIVPGLCQHEKNGFVLDHLAEDFRRILATNPKLQIQNYLRRSDLLTPLDQSLNNINRLYVSAMSSLR